MDQDEYRYRITRTGSSSAKYGDCEICGQYCPDVYLQTKEKKYRTPEGRDSWAFRSDAFGHEECLRSIRRSGDEVVTRCFDDLGDLIEAACEAEDIFDLDDLERYAEEQRERGK